MVGQVDVLKKSAAFFKIMDQIGYRIVEKCFHPQALASEVSTGRGAWDTADLISLNDVLARYHALTRFLK